MKEEIENGSFHNSEDSPNDPSDRDIITQEMIDRDLMPKVGEEYRKLLTFLKDLKCVDSAQIRSIYVPASSTETSSSAVFPEANVTYLDIDERAVSALKGAGYAAVAGDINTFTPDPPADMTVLFNTNGTNNPAHLLETIREGGYILENSWTSPSDESFFTDPRIELIGVIKERGSEENIELYFDAETDPADYLGDKGDIHETLAKKQERRERAFLFRKRFTDEEYMKTLPEYFQKKFRGKGEVEFDGKNYDYAIFDRSLQADLQNFVGFPQELGVLFISEEVPEEYKELLLTHEIDEFVNRPDEPDRCLLSLKAELTRVPDDMIDEYLQFRTEMMSGMVAFYERQKESPVNDGMLKQLRSSLAYLTSY